MYSRLYRAWKIEYDAIPVDPESIRPRGSSLSLFKYLV